MKIHRKMVQIVTGQASFEVIIIRTSRLIHIWVNNILFSAHVVKMRVKNNIMSRSSLCVRIKQQLTVVSMITHINLKSSCLCLVSQKIGSASTAKVMR